MVYEYNKANNDGNENDKKYLQYSELLLKAKQAGCGYWTEWKGVLYLAPVPIVSINSRQQYHSVKKPAIFWKKGLEVYYLNNVEFDKTLWKKIASEKIKAKEVFAIENLEQRRVAYELMDKVKMKDLADFKVLDEVKDDGCGNPMKLVTFNLDGYDTPFYYLECSCPTTGRTYFIETRQKTCWEAKMGSFGLSKEVRFDKEF